MDNKQVKKQKVTKQGNKVSFEYEFFPSTVPELPEEEYIPENHFMNIEGGGGTNKYGTGYGGRAAVNIPVTDNLMLSPYITGGGFKPTDGSHQGNIGSYGIQGSYRFSQGGNIPPQQILNNVGQIENVLSKGTDTELAMLTPGENVVNAEASRMYQPIIDKMNDHGRYMQAAQGGPVPTYASDGVKVPPPRFDRNDASTWGTRDDGSQKGAGYFGLLNRPDGDVSTELSVGIEMDGRETQIPLLVPTLTSDELTFVLNNNDIRKIPESIFRKAKAHAVQRMNAGLPVFAQEGEAGSLPKGYELYKSAGGSIPQYAADGKMITGDDFQRYADAVRYAENKLSHYDDAGNVARSPDNAIGMMQVTPTTAARPGLSTDVFKIADSMGVPYNKDAYAQELALRQVKDSPVSPTTLTEAERLLQNPAINIRMGDEYLYNMGQRYGGDLELAAAGYNAGPGGANKYKAAREANDFSSLPKRLKTETVPYVRKVMNEYSPGIREDMSGFLGTNASDIVGRYSKPTVPAYDFGEPTDREFKEAESQFNLLNESLPPNAPPVSDEMKQRMIERGDILSSGLYSVPMNDDIGISTFNRPYNKDVSEELWNRRMDAELDRQAQSFVDRDEKVLREKEIDQLWQDEYGTADSSVVTQKDMAQKAQNLEEEILDKVNNGQVPTEKEVKQLETLKELSKEVPPVEEKPPVPTDSQGIPLRKTPAPVEDHSVTLTTPEEKGVIERVAGFFGLGNNEVNQVVNNVGQGNVNRVKQSFLDRLMAVPGQMLDRAMVPATQAAIMYLVSRAMGYDNDSSLEWATNQMMTIMEENAKEEKALIKDGKYTPASIQSYMRSKDARDLIKVGKPAKLAEVSRYAIIGDKAVPVQRDTETGQYYYNDPKKGLVPIPVGYTIDKEDAKPYISPYTSQLWSDVSAQLTKDMTSVYEGIIPSKTRDAMTTKGIETIGPNEMASQAMSAIQASGYPITRKDFLPNFKTVMHRAGRAYAREAKRLNKEGDPAKLDNFEAFVRKEILVGKIGSYSDKYIVNPEDKPDKQVQVEMRQQADQLTKLENISKVALKNAGKKVTPGEVEGQIAVYFKQVARNYDKLKKDNKALYDKYEAKGDGETTNGFFHYLNTILADGKITEDEIKGNLETPQAK